MRTGFHFPEIYNYLIKLVSAILTQSGGQSVIPWKEDELAQEEKFHFKYQTSAGSFGRKLGLFTKK